MATLPNENSQPGGCWGSDFTIYGAVVQNGGYYTLNTGTYWITIQNRSNSVLGGNPFPNCVTSSPSTLDLEFNRYSYGTLDLGYCDTGDKIAIRFYTNKWGSSCTSAMGNMRGLATYILSKY